MSALPSALLYPLSAGCLAFSAYYLVKGLRPRNHGPFRLDVYNAEVRETTGRWPWCNRRSVDSKWVIGSACMGCGFVENAKAFKHPEGNPNDFSQALKDIQRRHSEEHAKIQAMYRTGQLRTPFVWVKAEDTTDIVSGHGGSRATGLCEFHF